MGKSSKKSGKQKKNNNDNQVQKQTSTTVIQALNASTDENEKNDTITIELLQKLRKDKSDQNKIMLNIIESEGKTRNAYNAFLTGYKKDEEYDMIIEKLRVKSIAHEHAEEYSPYTSDCPICLETINIVSYNSMASAPCCGGEICYECWEIDGYKKLKCCPFCRGNSTSDDNPRLGKLRAEKGNPMYQVYLGRSYLFGNDGYPVNVMKGLEWINLAVEQRHPVALYNMGVLHRDGFDQYVPQSDTKAIHFLKEAADLGFVDAMVELSRLYWGYSEESGLTRDIDAVKNAVRYTTLAYSQSSSYKYFKYSSTSTTRVLDGIDAYNMGNMFINVAHGHVKKCCFTFLCHICKEEESTKLVCKLHLLSRAVHYLEEAAVKGYEGAYYLLARTLLDIAVEIDMKQIVHSYAPRIMFWARKAAKGTRSKSDAIKLIVKMENMLKESCSTCGKKYTSTDVQFKRCSRCKSNWYCSKSCQVQHWNENHKSECVKCE